MKVEYARFTWPFPADRTVRLTRGHGVCKLVTCPVTFVDSLLIGDENASEWLRNQGKNPDLCMIVVDYDKGRYHDDPMVIFPDPESAILFTMRWC